MKDTIKINKGNTLLVAHRGLSSIETENTAAAFIAAGNRSYYGIETDIHRTADGKFVCIHDDNTSRVAGRRCNVTKKTYKEITGVKLKDFSMGAGARADLVVPLLEDYISICKKYGKHAVLELKDVFTLAELKKIVRIIDKIGHLQDTTFITFIPQNLYLLRSFLPNQSCQFLTDRLTDEIMQGIIAYRVDIDVHFCVLTEEIVKSLKSHNIKINVWTVDDPAMAETLVSWGVDYITTNILE